MCWVVGLKQRWMVSSRTMLASATYALVMWRSLWNGGKYMYMCVDTPALCILVLNKNEVTILSLGIQRTHFMCL